MSTTEKTQKRWTQYARRIENCDKDCTSLQERVRGQTAGLLRCTGRHLRLVCGLRHGLLHML